LSIASKGRATFSTVLDQMRWTKAAAEPTTRRAETTSASACRCLNRKAKTNSRGHARRSKTTNELFLQNRCIGLRQDPASQQRVGTGGKCQSAIGGEGDTVHRAFHAHVGMEFQARIQVPKVHGPIPVGRQRAAAIRRKSHAVHAQSASCHAT